MFLNEATHGIQALDPGLTQQDIQGAISGASARRVSGTSSDVQAQALHIIVKSLAKPYILVLVAGGLTMLMSVAMSWKKLVVDEAQHGDHIDSTIDEKT